MCGISGIIYKDLTERDQSSFREVANLSNHRGPDYTGYFSDERIELVHHRLSILDLDERSHQPFTGPDDNSNVLIYNGEIYNYKNLAEKYSLTLSTTSDTEVLFQLLTVSDFDLKELNGIFAFGVYDRKNSLLKITRDRLGVKPLYYFDCDRYFIFSSEAKVIYAYMDQMKMNYQALSEYMTFGHSASNQTIIEGVKKLGPGCSLILDLNSYETRFKTFWSVKEDLFFEQINPNYDEALEKTKSLLDKAVQRQCVSDVQVGAYLSGGIDSSAVVTLASKFTDRKLNTYSVNFDKNPNSELKLASMVAKKCRTNHHEFEVNTKNIDEYLPELIFQYDEPFADPAMIPLHLIAEKASDFSKVVLQGDGGDELFAGYGRHLDLKQYRYRKCVFQLLKNLHPSKNKRKNFLARYNSLNHRSHGKLMANMVQSDLIIGYKDFFLNGLGENLNSSNPLKEYELRDEKFSGLPLMQKMLYTDLEIILPNKFLEKVDKVNMYHSIEARVPLLDNDLLDYVSRLSPRIKIRKSTTKYFFRDVLKDLIPHEILNARKSSFGTPISIWLKTTLYDYAMDQFSKGEKACLPLNFELIKQYLNEHKNNVDSSKVGLIWRALVLTIWMKQYRHKVMYK